MQKKKNPIQIEIAEIIAMNLSSSFLKGVLVVSAVAARLAIYPITVLSPMLMIMPKPLPSLQIVPKKARLVVSSAFSLFVHSTVRSRSLVSPVREELSTRISVASMILMSAGTLSPSLTYTISPGTS